MDKLRKMEPQKLAIITAILVLALGVAGVLVTGRYSIVGL